MFVFVVHLVGFFYSSISKWQMGIYDLMFTFWLCCIDCNLIYSAVVKVVEEKNSKTLLNVNQVAIKWKLKKGKMSYD